MLWLCVSCWRQFGLHADCSPLALLGCGGAEAPWIVGPSPEGIDGAINGSISLVCQVRAHPAAQITWYKDGQALQPSQEVSATPGTLG